MPLKFKKFSAQKLTLIAFIYLPVSGTERFLYPANDKSHTAEAPLHICCPINAADSMDSIAVLLMKSVRIMRYLSVC